MSSEKQSTSAMVAVMGITGTGKSSIIKLLTNDDNVHIGHNTESETSNIIMSHYFDANAHTSVTLVDTPGFDDSREGVTDTDILEKIVAFLQPEKGDGRTLNGIVYLHRISDPRVGGVSKKNLRMFRSLCGDGKLGHVRIVTTNWDRVSESEGSAREAHLAQTVFLPFIQGGAIFRRHDGTVKCAQSIMAELIGQAPVMMQIQEELNAGRTLGATSAGAVIIEEMEALKEKHRKELESLKKELDDAVKAHDDALRAELAEERQALEQKMMRAIEDRQRLGKRFEEISNDKVLESWEAHKQFDPRATVARKIEAAEEKAENERRDLQQSREMEQAEILKLAAIVFLLGFTLFKFIFHFLQEE